MFVEIIYRFVLDNVETGMEIRCVRWCLGNGMKTRGEQSWRCL